MKRDLQLLPYLTFDGTCGEAMAFYKQVFGGELTLNYFNQMHDDLAEADKHKVMHSALENEFMSLMASDTVPGMETNFGDNVRIAVTGTESPKLAAIFQKLGQDGMVFMPFEQQAWGQELGMLTDKFGTHWMVSVQ